jgi:chromosome partitioning protein
VKDTGKPFLFETQAKQQATITAQAAQAIAALSEHGRVARSFIADRVAYAAAMRGGSTAPEIAPKGPAAEEIPRPRFFEHPSCATPQSLP